MFTQQDLEQLREKGISQEQVSRQLRFFSTGFPFLQIVAPASYFRGIMRVGQHEQEAYLKRWESYLGEEKSVVKFVPASGAASRMFKDLYAFLDAEYEEPTTEFEKTFFTHIRRFAFAVSLDETCRDLYGKEVSALCDEGKYKEVVAALLNPEGLDYGNLPKGLLLFHSYPEGNRTPVGEHLTEGTLYARRADGLVKVHFTVSAEHRDLFELLVAARKLSYEIKLGARFAVSYSIQKPATDTLAVDMENQPFRDEDGTLLFRPGGHGALIENLNDIDADIIFIKNIDNVVPDRLKEEEAHCKKLLGGILVSMQQRAFAYLDKLDSGKVTSDELEEMLAFTENELCITHSETFDTDDALKAYLKRKLDRPFRVCGMVRNQGEPGGGPFIVVNPDGTASLQILESSQINRNDTRAMDAFRNGSHFNPVDLVCGVKCYQGNKFDLTKFVDPNTGFISHKSKNGRELKALELPGLWNGAMSDWNTLFVEVPLSTFNPVKTVNDLLRPEHQQ
ncbi:MAG: DUF4301 family protein [bacterium]|nr:DUF4301 family protein [bacterium]MDD3625115.1 DUF4301 family protein [Proteiniphilum sp.]MDD3968605.1 DUF4301 family protein [Proteiniphilum sp.]